ncbi:glutamate receptor-interacting protein 2-like [Anneissia japonica]|uniref:glutamate receptor-interacting protein 2-like n=1 Tax=Anneissia japonica TaxID=1529436 RepID=UPI0014259824|nr:glutamate receptor-interacting protein 2-like [Anneissia japonica]
MPGWLPSCLKPSPEKDNKKNGATVQECSEGSRSRTSSIADERKATTQVRLEKKSGSGFGLTISGGVDKDGSPRVSKMRVGAVAQRSDLLQVGDLIRAVNAIKTAGLRHDEVINLLKNAGDIVTLEIEYELPMMPEENGIQVLTKMIEVCLPKEGTSFGFTVRGGVHSNPSKTHPITVSQIRTGGPADRDGTMKIGDHVISVDGILLSSYSHQDALQVIKQAGQEAVFVLEYDVSVMDAVTNANGPLLIEVAKTPGSHLGVALSSTMRAAKPCIVIDSIKPASIADRCGALHVGDEIRAIDGSSTDSMTVAEAMQLLQSALEQIKLEILPVSQFTPKLSYPHTKVQSVSQTITRASSRPTTPVGCSAISNYSTLPSNASLVHKSNTLTRRANKHTSNISLSSSTNGLISGTQVCHTETIDLTLHSANGHYGLLLEGGVFESEILGIPAVVSFLEPGGVAERSGVLNIGDRILAINGTYTEDLTLEEAHQTLRVTGQRCFLQIEFDIAESVVPSSGTFHIKLPKTDYGLGITVSAPKNRKRGDPLLISHIKKGSVAHRVGSIEPGDKLLAIDGILLDQCTVEDAAQILREADEIVRLRLKKDEAFSDEPDVSGAVTYSVELIRHGGPLGITISGTEEPFDPIIISGLTEGGLAGRTGAIHVGDRILAINGITLRGQTLTNAIHLLKTSGDRVHLKISRSGNSAIDGSLVNGSEIGDLKNGIDHSSQDITPAVTASALELWNGVDTGYHSNKRVRNYQSMSPATRRSRRGKNSSRNRQNQRRTRSTSRNRSNQQNQYYRSPISDDDWEDSRLRGYDSHDGMLSDQDDTYYRRGHRRHFEHSKQTSDLMNEITASLSMVNYSQDCETNGRYRNGNENGFGPSRSSTLPSSNRSTSFSIHDQLQTMHKTTPAELHKVILYKDTDVEDFGFSVSDGVYENGVYVNMVRPGGPASRNGNIKTYDRVLQINGTRTRDFDCCMVVPLIADSGNTLEMLLSRNPNAQPANGAEKELKDSSLGTDVSKISSLQTL